jgi:hypothetical protein
MSGYLHRMAARALRPQPSVHPFVESIFSVPRREDPVEPLVQRVIPQPTAEQSSDAPQTSASPVGPPVAQRTTTSPREDRPPFQPLLPQQVISAGLPPMRAAVNPKPSQAARPTAEATRKDHPETSPEVAFRFEHIVSERRSASEARVVPEGIGAQEMRAAPEAAIVSQAHIVPDDPARTALAPVVKRRLSPRSAGLWPKQELAPASRTPQPPADDIQIHIGRIEVVALPQPAPRPAPAPTRKGMNLDEYLSRRNGRSG